MLLLPQFINTKFVFQSKGCWRRALREKNLYKTHSAEKTLASNWKALVKKAGQQRYVDMMLLTVDAPISMFITTICSWMASRGEAPPIISPVIAPGSEIRPTVLALSRTGESEITRALFTCCNVAWCGVAPRANAVSTCKKHTTTQMRKLCLLTRKESGKIWAGDLPGSFVFWYHL